MRVPLKPAIRRKPAIRKCFAEKTKLGNTEKEFLQWNEHFSPVELNGPEITVFLDACLPNRVEELSTAEEPRDGFVCRRSVLRADV